MKKYVTERHNNVRIREVEIERETDKCVWIAGRKSSKVSEWAKFHDTWAEAHAYLLARAESKLNAARRNLEQAQGDYGNVKGMKPPKAQSSA